MNHTDSAICQTECCLSVTQDVRYGEKPFTTWVAKVLKMLVIPGLDYMTRIK